MRLRRLCTAALAALLALLAPGPQAWAAAVRTGVSASGQSLPAGQVVAVPASFSNSLSPLASGISLDLAGKTSAAVPSVKTAGISAVLPVQTPAAAQSMPAPAILSASRIPAAAPAAAPSRTQAKIGTMAEQAVPVLRSVSDSKASPADLRGGADELQRILESGLRRAAPADVDPVLGTEGSAPTPAGKLSASQDASLRAAAQQPIPELTPEQKGKFRFYAGAVSAVKVGIEALNLAVPLLLLNTLHAAMAVSTLYLAAEVASIFAGLVGGALVDRIGAHRALALTGFAQAAAIIGVPLAIASGGALALPIVYGLFMLNGVASELFDVARRAALPQIVGQNEGLLRKYNGSLYVWREIAATAGVFGAGWLVHNIGAMATIWAHPAFCVAAALAALRLLRGGRRGAVSEGQASSSPEKGGGLQASLKSWWQDIVRGTKYVVSEKKLRTIVLVNIPLNALHKIFHTLVAVIYASQILHNPAMAAVMLGAWNIGELAGAFYLERRGPQSRLSNWLRLAGVASLAVWGWWLFPAAWAGVGISFLLAAAMIGNELGTSSYMQATVPEKELGAVSGFIYAFARAVGILALLGSGLAWDVLGPMGGFLALAVIFTIAAPVYLLASRRFSGDKIDHADAPAQD